MSESSETLKSMLIGGEWIAHEDAAFESVNPATGTRNYLISAASEAQVDQAVEAAWQAQRQPAWRDMLPHQRAAILRRIADGMDQNAPLTLREVGIDLNISHERVRQLRDQALRRIRLSGSFAKLETRYQGPREAPVK